MQEVYAALLLHENKQVITEENLKKVLSASGAPIDEGKLKALVASLEGTNIDELIAQAAIVPSAPAEVKEKEEKKEEKGPEEAAAGLSSLFG